MWSANAMYGRTGNNVFLNKVCQNYYRRIVLLIIQTIISPLYWSTIMVLSRQIIRVYILLVEDALQKKQKFMWHVLMEGWTQCQVITTISQLTHSALEKHSEGFTTECFLCVGKKTIENR